MSKKSKRIIYYILTLIFVFTAPILFLRYVILPHTDEVFYERLQRDNEICYQRAERDSVDTRWCDEISKASKLAYYESERRKDFSFLHIIFIAIFLILAFRVNSLSKQVSELKEKIDA